MSIKRTTRDFIFSSAHTAQLLDSLARVEEIERHLGGHLGLIEGLMREMFAEFGERLDLVLDGVAATSDGIRDADGAYLLPPLDARYVPRLRWPVAEFLNWATGPASYAAQRGLWINHPVYVAYSIGDIHVANVNERIVEIPFVFGALEALPDRASIIDLGGAESTVSLSLASLGHNVTVVDPNGYALEHPNLSVVALPLHAAELPPESADALIALSSIEHFGTGAYATEIVTSRLDIEAVTLAKEILKPGGILILTVPFGDASVDGFQRTYDVAGIDELLAGWTKERFEAAWQLDERTWQTSTSPTDRLGDRGVAMIVARPGD